MSEESTRRNPAAWFRDAVVAVHRRLLPQNEDIGWTPYLWLFYTTMFVWRLWQHGSVTEQVFGGLSYAVFLVLYFDGFWHQGKRLGLNIAALVALAVIWTPFNHAAMAFFIFAAAFCGSVGPPKTGWRVIFGIVVVVALTSWGFGMPWFWLAATSVLCCIVGGANVYFLENIRRNADLRRSRQEVEQLAALAERERIARDLHDLLGHTLSVITIKAELARKLSERGDPRAATEIGDVESISREALRQVREAVAGFRESGFSGEVARAQIACDARDIELKLDVEAVDLDARQEAALAMVLREAITNVVRHSRAEHCSIRLETAPGEVRLTVADDGRGGAGQGRGSSGQGQGLRGMRQRLTELGGQLEVNGPERPAAEGRAGWRVLARLPLDEVAGQGSENAPLSSMLAEAEGHLAT